MHTLTYCNSCTANMLALLKRSSTILMHSPHNAIRSKNTGHIWACHFGKERRESVATLHGTTAYYKARPPSLTGSDFAHLCNHCRLCCCMQLKGLQPSLMCKQQNGHWN